jgi:hypothetical protein
MFEDIHKIDSAVFKPDPAKAKSHREGKPGKRRAANEKNPKELLEPKAGEIPLTGTDEDNKEHPFLDILV